MSVIAAQWTIAEYHLMISSGILEDRRVELLKGEIVEMSLEGEPHAYFSSEAAAYLIRLLGDRATIRSAKPITLPNNSEPEPDIAIAQPLGRTYLEHHPYPENIFWLIEYSDSTLIKDLETKTKIYAEVGIPEYWVVNLKKRQLIVFRDPEDGDLQDLESLNGEIIDDKLSMRTAQGEGLFNVYVGTVQIDGQEFTVPVVAGEEIPEIIIGMEWLKTKRLLVDLPAGVLTLG